MLRCMSLKLAHCFREQADTTGLQALAIADRDPLRRDRWQQKRAPVAVCLRSAVAGAIINEVAEATKRLAHVILGGDNLVEISTRLPGCLNPNGPWMSPEGLSRLRHSCCRQRGQRRARPKRAGVVRPSGAGGELLASLRPDPPQLSLGREPESSTSQSSPQGPGIGA